MDVPDAPCPTPLVIFILGPCPVVYFLSGLTCTEQNFVTKANAQLYASQYGIVIVAPDTSPRGAGMIGS